MCRGHRSYRILASSCTGSTQVQLTLHNLSGRVKQGDEIHGKPPTLALDSTSTACRSCQLVRSPAAASVEPPAISAPEEYQDLAGSSRAAESVGGEGHGEGGERNHWLPWSWRAAALKASGESVRRKSSSCGVTPSSSSSAAVAADLLAPLPPAPPPLPRRRNGHEKAEKAMALSVDTLIRLSLSAAEIDSRWISRQRGTNPVNPYAIYYYFYYIYAVRFTD